MKEALAEERFTDAAYEASHLSPGRVAQVLADSARGAAIPALRELREEMAGDVLAHMPTPLVADLLSSLEEEEARHFFRRIPPEYAADVYHAWMASDPAWAETVLAGVEDPARSVIRELGRYPPDTAGAAMVVRHLSIRSGSTVRDTVEAIRSAPVGMERSAYVYVVDEHGRPLGVLSIRQLLTADADEVVDRIMASDLVVVEADDDAVAAARLLRNRGLELLPVVSAESRLLGVITQDDAFELLREELAQDFVEIAQGSPDESFFTPPIGAVRRRLPWMGANVFLNLGAVFVISSFESTIAQVAILAAFLPMITDMGGNVGIQALSVAIRSIALGEVRIRDFWRAVRKEVAVGLINGAVLGALFGGVALLLEGNPWLGLVAGTALGVNVFVAGVVGGSLPFIIKRFGRDPAMMTGPFLTTVTDITGVTIYLGLSTYFLTRIVA